jgi:hypothetical protein
MGWLLWTMACVTPERFYADYAAAQCEHDARCNGETPTPKEQRACRESTVPVLRQRWEDECCVFTPDNARPCIHAWTGFRCGVGQPDACDVVFDCNACMSVDPG